MVTIVTVDDLLDEARANILRVGVGVRVPDVDVVAAMTDIGVEGVGGVDAVEVVVVVVVEFGWRWSFFFESCICNSFKLEFFDFFYGIFGCIVS